MRSDLDARRLLHRRLKRDLGPAVKKTKTGTWTTTSNLPHEIRLHTQSGVDLVRVSAGMLIDAKPTKALLEDLNALNTERAFSRRVIIDRKVLVVGEMPVVSLRRGDLEQLVSMVFCFARLEAPLLEMHGGRLATKPPAHLAPDFDSLCATWLDVLRASGTATARELAVWLEAVAGCECFIECDGESVAVMVGSVGYANPYPFRIEDLRQDAVNLQEQQHEDDDEE